MTDLVLTFAPYAAGVVIGLIVLAFFLAGIVLAAREFWFAFHDWRRRVARPGYIDPLRNKPRLPR